MNEKREKAPIIVFDGPDGCGKQTQTEEFRKRLDSEGAKLYTTSFPNYKSDSSAAVRMYLAGEIAEKANDVGAKAASAFYAIDRYITFKREMEAFYNNPDYTIVLDRYVSANIVHQTAKVIAANTNPETLEQEIIEFIKWLDNLEHNDFGIPRPDITFYLQLPTEYSLKLMEKRVNKITQDMKKDIHEADKEHLKNASIAGNMAAKLLGWEVIKCLDENGNMRSVEDIHEEVYSRYKAKIQK